MTQENVVVVGFTEPSKAYEALSVLKECDAGVVSGSRPRPSWSARRGRAAHPREHGQRQPRRHRERLADRDADRCPRRARRRPARLGAGAMTGGAFDIDRADDVGRGATGPR